MAPVALEARRLAHRYPGASVPALDGIDLALHAGEIFGLLGPNGAGKTTAIAILSTMILPSAGSLVIDGLDPRRHRRAVRRRIGLVPQEIALYPTLTPRENLLFFGRLQGLRGSRLHRRIAAVLADVGLGQQADRPIKTFSGGMQRRVNLAVGLLHEPRVLFLDEPTVGIDPQSRRLILERIAALKDQGTTVLYTTHTMEEAQQLCQRVAIMDHGRILAQDTVARLLAGPPGARDLGDLFMKLTGNALRDS